MTAFTVPSLQSNSWTTEVARSTHETAVVTAAGKTGRTAAAGVGADIEPTDTQARVCQGARAAVGTGAAEATDGGDSLDAKEREEGSNCGELHFFLVLAVGG